MQLTTRQRRALTAICDTFAPGGDGAPPASVLGVPDAIAAAADRNPRAAERRQLAQLLSAWDSHVVTAFSGGGWERFSALPPQRREAVLLSWADSRAVQRRAVFHALRKAALVMYYAVPAPDGSPSPVWDAIGYPGPLGRREDAPPKRLGVLRPGRDERLECDVVIVGSGAGGGTAAGVLAAAGLDVVVLEAGEYYDEEDFDGGELTGLMRLYAGGGAGASHDGSIALVAGECLGGGTVVNYTTSFPTPEAVRQEWAARGLAAFAAAEYEESTRAVQERLGTNLEHSRAGVRDALMERGLMELGWHVDAQPRNVDGCDQGIECGRCGFGCRLGAKRSTLKTWLSDAHDRGARLVVGTWAERVVTEAGAARGVHARASDGHRVEVRARAVVAAGGAIQTPALLKRSGLANANVGRHLKLHPVGVAIGIMEEEVRPWEGTMQARYSREHADLNDGHGVIYETGPLNPSLLLPFAPWRSGRQHAELMGAMGHVTPIGIIVRDRDGGEVRVGRDGRPVVRYRLSDFDAGHLRHGLQGAARILEAAGASRVISGQTKLVSYDPGRRGSLEQFMRDADACGFGTGQVNLGSFHIMSSARMGSSPQDAACDPHGQTWDVRDLYVADASLLPTAPGVNPMVSIEATAHMVARGLAERLA